VAYALLAASLRDGIDNPQEDIMTTASIPQPIVHKQETVTTPRSALPVRKVNAAGLAGALMTVIAWMLSRRGISMPPDVAAALTTVLSFVAGYLTPPAEARAGQ